MIPYFISPYTVIPYDVLPYAAVSFKIPRFKPPSYTPSVKPAEREVLVTESKTFNCAHYFNIKTSLFINTDEVTVLFPIVFL